MINNAINDGLWKDKGDIYCEAMREIGAEENILIEYGQNTVEGGYAAAQKLLRHRHPQAIYCANDYMAIGVMQALNSKGISVPKDIAVMGNDDIAFAKMTAPKMTTVAINTQAAGRRAANILFYYFEQNKSVFPNEKISVELVVRETA